MRQMQHFWIAHIRPIIMATREEDSRKRLGAPSSILATMNRLDRLSVVVQTTKHNCTNDEQKDRAELHQAHCTTTWLEQFNSQSKRGKQAQEFANYSPQQATSAKTTTTTSTSSTTKAPLERLIVFVLPLIFVFLLPSIKLERDQPLLANSNWGHEYKQADVTSGQLVQEDADLLTRLVQRTELATSELLRQLIRLPLDKIRLQSGGFVVGSEAKEISSKSDLQEEETHMLLLAPAEHRSAYPAAQGGGGGGGGYHQYGGSVGESGPQQGGDMLVQAVPGGGGGGSGAGSPDYGPESGSGTEHGGGVLASPAQSEAGVVSETGQATSSALQARADLPAVRALNVKCEKNHMTVNIVFDRPFYGMVFSKGHYNDQKCVHLPPNSGQTSVNFDIHLGKCGMSSSDAGAPGTAGGSSSSALQQQQQQQQQQPNGVYIENTIIIQYDPLVQEIYDQARKLRCTWYDYYEKSVTFRPYNVDMLDAVTANFLGDNIQCWMQIQVGKGPWSSEVAGIVKIGQTMTMVLAIKDDENRFDMLVRNCVAHDGKHQPIQLVDEYGCVARPKIIGKFQKVRNFGSAATVVSYAHFQAFKFPDSMSVHFQCVIQVCRYECPEPVCNQPAELSGSSGSPNQVPSPGGGSGGSGADYATSGTEMVASKEPHPALIAGTGGGYFAAAHPTMTGGYANQSSHVGGPAGGSQNIQLKLDEAQGRVQVKLDTSMMAGLPGGPGAGPARASQVMQQVSPNQPGPLPPHLLHMAVSATSDQHPHQQHPQQQQQGSGRAYLGSSYYRPAIGGGGGGQALLATSTTGGVSSARHQQQQAAAAAPPPTGARSQPPPGGPQVHHYHQHDKSAQLVHYSPQVPGGSSASRRSAYANRLGDLQTAVDEHQQDHRHDHQLVAPPYDAEYPLSLIASPRGLKLGTTTTSSAHQHHRVKRDGLAGGGGAKVRPVRHLKPSGSTGPGPDSTSVQTQRTIQVVSPDDVAFSLLDPSDDYYPSEPNNGSVQPSAASKALKARQQAASGTSVCFSATRFLWGVLVTLATLASSIVIVTYVILRQRFQLDKKLSSVFVTDPSGGRSMASERDYVTSASNNTTTPPPSAQQILAQRQKLHHQHQLGGPGLCPVTSAHISQQRQQEEIQQRNNYLSRLYSQFAPSNYWR